MGKVAEKVTDDLYEFSDFRGTKYECVRGQPDTSLQAREQAIVIGDFKPPKGKPHLVPDFGHRWHIYSGDEYFGSYTSPYDAAKVFAIQVGGGHGLFT